jgi:hypothetical protein
MDKTDISLYDMISYAIRVTDINKEYDLENNYSSFTSKKTQSITIKDYFKRLFNFANCSEECFTIALIYINRIEEKTTNNKKHPGIILFKPKNAHRLLITALLIAIKYRDDIYQYNNYYAKIGGILIEELNKLELEFLKYIEYDLYVRPITFDNFKKYIMFVKSAPQVDNKITRDSNDYCKIV